MKINFINLPHRIDRLRNVVEQISCQSITDYHIWPGIIHDTPVTGISMAFKQIVRDAKTKDLPMVCIAEDDIFFTAPCAWEFFLNNLPNDFDLYLGSYYSGWGQPGNTVDKFRGMTLIVVAKKFYDIFLNLPEDRNIDMALDGLGDYKVCPFFVAIQVPGYSDNVKKMVDYSNRIPANIIFTGR